MKKVTLNFKTVREPGPVSLPPGAKLVEIVNNGSHGTLDTVIINNSWRIAGGTREYPAFFFKTDDYDETDYQLIWVPTASDFDVTFIYKLYKNG